MMMMMYTDDDIIIITLMMTSTSTLISIINVDVVDVNVIDVVDDMKIVIFTDPTLTMMLLRISVSYFLSIRG